MPASGSNTLCHEFLAASLARAAAAARIARDAGRLDGERASRCVRSGDFRSDSGDGATAPATRGSSSTAAASGDPASKSRSRVRLFRLFRLFESGVFSYRAYPEEADSGT